MKDGEKKYIHAFPFKYPLINQGTVVGDEYNKGMTLRDYFAGQVAAGLMSDPSAGWGSPKEFGEVCYGWADGLLEEREKNEKS